MKPNVITRGLLAGLVLAAGAAHAFRADDQPFLPNIDARAPGAAGGARAVSLARLQQSAPGEKADFDAVTGSPRWVAPGTGFLTGARSAVQSAALVQGGDPHAATKEFLAGRRALFGYGPEILDQARVKRNYTTTHNGLRTAVWEQTLGGIGVFEGLMVSHTTSRGELVNISSRFMAAPARAAARGTPNSGALLAAPPLSAAQALALAAADVGESVDAEQLVSSGAADEAERSESFSGPVFKGDARVWLSWLPLDAQSMRLCWETVFFSRTQNAMFLALVDAESGKVWVRRTLTVHAAAATYRVYTGASPTPMSPGFLYPMTNQPPYVSRELITLTALDTNASPNGWIGDGTNETRGNNVNAYLDWDANNSPDLPWTQGSPQRVFDFAMDLSEHPYDYHDASVAQLFYMCNWYHDWLYELGFTEAAGNFQNDNFGRGGAGGDAVNAEAQDGSGVNNSNFSPTPDGIPPRMQMFLFTGATPARDGVFDTHVVLHEYTHGVSSRLVGGGAGLYELVSLGLGEGWSDFFALAVITSPEDDPDGSYPMAPYCTWLMAGETQNYYYGIRRYPYSSDMAKSPLTFKDIDPDQSDPHTGVPRSSIWSTAPSGASEAHNMGEVWCATLWDVRSALIKKWGGPKGAQLALQIVLDGLRLSPPNPNFLEARDAIIQADLVDNAGANYALLWKAFAKRGLGAGARAPGSSATAGLAEAYDAADDLAVSGSTSPASGPVGGPFNPLTNTWTLLAGGSDDVVWSAGAQSNWLTLSPVSGALTAGEQTMVTAWLAPAVFSLPAGLYTNRLFFTNLSSGAVQSREFILRVGLKDYFAEIVENPAAVLQNHSFTFTPDGSASFYSVCAESISAFPTDPTNGNVVTLGDDSLVSVTIPSGKAVPFYHTNTTLFWIDSNGGVILGAGSVSNERSYDNHFSLRRIAGFLDDLDPRAGGTVSWKELSDRVVVTYQDVPEYGGANPNNFQIEMFFDGRIRLSYLQMDAGWGVAGLSEGNGTPSDFAPSDFSYYQSCGAPDAWLSVSAPALVLRGAGVMINAATVKLSAPLGTDTKVAMVSSDPHALAPRAIVTIPAGATSAAFSIQAPSNGKINGPETVTLSAHVDGLRSVPALILVVETNAPAFSISLPDSACYGSQVEGVVSADLAPQYNAAVRLTISGSNAAAVSAPGWVVIPAGETDAVFLLTIAAPTTLPATNTVTVSAHVSGWTDAQANLVIGGSPATNVSLSVPAMVISGNGVLTNYGYAALSNLLATDLSVPLSSSGPAVAVPAFVTIPAGAKGAPFNITVADSVSSNTPVRLTEGVSGAVADVLVWDWRTPQPAVNPIPADGSSSNAALVALSWSRGPGEGAECVANGTFETGNLAGWTPGGTNFGSFAANNGSILPASGDAATAPWAGGFGALAQRSGSGAFWMRQDVALPTGASAVSLQWADAIRNFAGIVQSNQQFRVEVRDTNDALLATIFASTNTGLASWTARAADLSDFRGQTVRLRFAVTAALAPLDVHLDNISVRASFAPAAAYDIYLGTNANLSAANYLGSTTNAFWPAVVAPVGSNYWRVDARRSGTNFSPVWEFETSTTVLVSNVQITEGNLGTNRVAVFTLALSEPCARAVSLGFYTADGTAVAGRDYVALTNGALTFAPGETNKSISVTVIGNNTPEPDKTFYLVLSGVTNAIPSASQAACVILNDDPWPGIATSFAFGAIESPQEQSNAFPVVVTAHDSFGNLASNTASFHLSGLVSGENKPLLGSYSPVASSSYSAYTLGFVFTPSTNMTVTHARHYFGTKVSIWTDSGTLLASVPVSGSSGVWSNTAFAAPVKLTAGTRYRVGVYTGGQTYAWAANTFPMTLAAGVISQSCYSGSDSVPTNAASRGLYLLDLRYFAGEPAVFDVAPSVANGMTNGIWTGYVSVPICGTNLELQADDGQGHVGLSAPFNAIYVGPRALSVQNLSGGLVFSWLPPLGSYRLESTETLVPPQWQPVTNAPVLAGTNLVITNAPGTATRFYRLRKP